MKNSSATFVYSSDTNPIPRLVVGFAFLAIALTACGALTLQQLGLFVVPGCGPQGGCQTAIAGSWGNLFGWPLSFVGLAVGLLALGGVFVMTGSRRRARSRSDSA